MTSAGGYIWACRSRCPSRLLHPFDGFGASTLTGVLAEPVQGHHAGAEDRDVSLVRAQPQFRRAAGLRQPPGLRAGHDPVLAAVYEQDRGRSPPEGHNPPARHRPGRRPHPALVALQCPVDQRVYPRPGRLSRQRLAVRRAGVAVNGYWPQNQPAHPEPPGLAAAAYRFARTGLVRLAFRCAYPKIVTGISGRPTRRAAGPPLQLWRLAGQASARPVNARITMIW